MKWYPTPAGEACVESNTAGMPYEEISCVYPALESINFAFEKEFDPVPRRDWMVRHPEVPIAACIAYAVFVVVGQAYFKKRKAWDWRQTMAMWNLGLSVFSFVGVVRMLPKLVHNFSYYSMHENFCMDPESHYGSGTSGLWVQFFVLSKFPELLDTFFIVIHKKNLIFLHWYHHISVLLYCWHSYVTKAPTGIIFSCMNYAVHALMYFYYFLMAVKLKPKWFNPVWITVAQIAQMVVGVAVTISGWYIMKTKPEGCALSKENNLAALVMYGSYLFLFLQFFFGRYFAKKTKAKTI